MTIPLPPESGVPAPVDPNAREVPVDWESLEDAFENNAPEVHSYLQLTTGEVLRVVDGVADPQMHVRIASDANYLRIDPVSSREQYRWMERFIPMVEDLELRAKLGQAIDGKGAFRRFKDVLMAYGADREKWFTFRSERLRTFMEAWLAAHAIRAVPRPQWSEPAPSEVEVTPESPGSGHDLEEAKAATGRRTRSAEASREHLRELIESLAPRDLESLAAFAEFLKARRAARGFAHHAEHHHGEKSDGAVSSGRGAAAAPSAPSSSPASSPKPVAKAGGDEG
jgi:hypothetical protein